MTARKKQYPQRNKRYPPGDAREVVMRDNGTYFQFDLCALAFGKTENERLNAIIEFGCVEAGHAECDKLSVEARALEAERLASDPATPVGFKKGSKSHLCAILGAKKIGVAIGGFQRMIDGWRSLSSFRDEFAARYGAGVRVRIPKALLFEVRDKAGMSYSELACLAAIVSCIGAKKYPVRITREEIQRRMLGYKSKAAMRAEIANRQDGATPLPVWRVGRIRDRLHERRFFARARANERQTFYSIRQNEAELQDALVQSKTYSPGFHSERRHKDAEFMARIKAEKANADIKANSPIKVNCAPGKYPHGARSVSTPCSLGVRFNTNSLYKNSSIETHSSSAGARAGENCKGPIWEEFLAAFGGPGRGEAYARHWWTRQDSRGWAGIADWKGYALSAREMFDAGDSVRIPHGGPP